MPELVELRFANDFDHANIADIGELARVINRIDCRPLDFDPVPRPGEAGGPVEDKERPLHDPTIGKLLSWERRGEFVVPAAIKGVNLLETIAAYKHPALDPRIGGRGCMARFVVGMGARVDGDVLGSGKNSQWDMNINRANDRMDCLKKGSPL